MVGTIGICQAHGSGNNNERRHAFALAHHREAGVAVSKRPPKQTEWHVQTWFYATSSGGHVSRFGRGNWFTVAWYSTEYQANQEFERRPEAAVRIIKLEVVRKRDARIKEGEV